MQLSPEEAPPGGAGTPSNAPATEPKVRTLAELIDAYQAAYAANPHLPGLEKNLAVVREELRAKR